MIADKTPAEEWENLCKQCGTCCFEKIDKGDGRIIHTKIPCRYLDISTRKCKIYDRRFEIYPECIQLTENLARELDWLHDGCGYREAFRSRPRKLSSSRKKKR